MSAKSNKREFFVFVREVHIQEVRVEAEDENDAKDRVAKGEGEYVDNSLEYSHSLDPEEWTVDQPEQDEKEEEPKSKLVLPKNTEYQTKAIGKYLNSIMMDFRRELKEKTDELLKKQMEILNVTTKDLTRQSDTLKDTVMWKGVPILEVEYKGTSATIRYMGSETLSKLASENRKEPG